MKSVSTKVAGARGGAAQFLIRCFGELDISVDNLRLVFDNLVRIFNDFAPSIARASVASISVSFR
jgi:hypothetical protein